VVQRKVGNKLFFSVSSGAQHLNINSNHYLSDEMIAVRGVKNSMVRVMCLRCSIIIVLVYLLDISVGIAT
jgi:hypothetical protein